MEIIPRTSAPSKSNKYYIHTSQGGLNPCILIEGKSTIPNCVGFAWGRYCEETGATKCSLSTNNAEDWFGKAKKAGMKTGKKPKVGSVICWSKGKVGVDSDGAGHVAIVEIVYDDGSILISQSGYGCGMRMWTQKLYPPYSLSGYKLQGFIYNPKVNNTITKTKKITFRAGQEYTICTTSGLNVRKKASKSSKVVKGLKYKTKVTCKEINGDWMRIKDGWICTKENGKYYVS